MPDSPGLSIDVAAVADVAKGMEWIAGGGTYAEAQAANQVLNTHAPFGMASASDAVS